MSPSREKILLALIPLVAVATLALGLRIGARTSVRGAVVDGALPSKSGLAWSATVSIDDRGVREALARIPIEVTAKRSGAHGNESVVATGTSDEDGVVEFALPLRDVTVGEALELVLADRSTGTVLASGAVSWSGAANEPTDHAPRLAPATRKDGAIHLEVAPYGDRVSPTYTSPVFVRATNASGRERIALAARDGSRVEWLTSDKYNSTAPAFSRDGRWLWFLSERQFTLVNEDPWGDRNTGPFFDKRSKIYAVALQAGNRFPFLPDDELAKEEDKGEAKEDDPNTKDSD